MAIEFVGHKLGENCENVVMWCGMQTDHIGGCVSICIHTHLHVYILSIHMHACTPCSQALRASFDCELQSSHTQANTSPLSVSSLGLLCSSIRLTITLLIFMILFAFASNSVLGFIFLSNLGSGGVAIIVELEHLSCDCHDDLMCVLHGVIIQ